MASSTPSDYRDGACTQPARVDAGPNFPQKIWPGERPASGRQTFRNQGVRLSGTHSCQLELELEESLASRLELPNAFAVRFQCDDAAFEQLGAALSRVFSGKGPP
jgi:hypothetical protein